MIPQIKIKKKSFLCQNVINVKLVQLQQTTKGGKTHDKHYFIKTSKYIENYRSNKRTFKQKKKKGILPLGSVVQNNRR